MDTPHRKFAVFNPSKMPVEQLPFIYGFNNGGVAGLMDGCLIAEDGTFLGGHTCSNEGFMYGDLGILEGHRLDRHEAFRKHYPNGYRMAFVSYDEVKEHAGLQRALSLLEQTYPEPTS